MKGISIIISARNEYPQVAMTVDNLMLDMYNSGIHDWEIIIADNGSTDATTRFWKYAYDNPYAKQADHQLRNEYKKSPRGMVGSGRLRFVYDPVFSNVGARHKAVKYAKYDTILFSDAHISVKPGSIATMWETLQKHGGIIHAPVAWMGASIYSPGAGVQYSYKIGEKIWGTWNRTRVTDEGPFYIPVSGHCFIMMNKAEYMSFGGYDTNQRVYGGGENYLDTLYWMMGSTVMVEMRALVFHLSAGRGYSYDSDSLIHNMMLTAYTLGGEKWSERILLTYLEKMGTDKKFVRELYRQALEEGKPKREFIEKNAKYTLDEVLGVGKPHDCDGRCYKNQTHAMRPWDRLNDEMWGRHISFVVIYTEWLKRLNNPEAINFLKNSPHQKDLFESID